MVYDMVYGVYVIWDEGLVTFPLISIGLRIEIHQCTKCITNSPISIWSVVWIDSCLQAGKQLNTQIQHSSKPLEMHINSCHNIHRIFFQSRISKKVSCLIWTIHHLICRSLTHVQVILLWEVARMCLLLLLAQVIAYHPLSPIASRSSFDISVRMLFRELVKHSIFYVFKTRQWPDKNLLTGLLRYNLPY